MFDRRMPRRAGVGNGEQSIVLQKGRGWMSPGCRGFLMKRESVRTNASRSPMYVRTCFRRPPPPAPSHSGCAPSLSLSLSLKPTVARAERAQALSLSLCKESPNRPGASVWWKTRIATTRVCGGNSESLRREYVVENSNRNDASVTRGAALEEKWVKSWSVRDVFFYFRSVLIWRWCFSWFCACVVCTPLLVMHRGGRRSHSAWFCYVCRRGWSGPFATPATHWGGVSAARKYHVGPAGGACVARSCRRKAPGLSNPARRCLETPLDVHPVSPSACQVSKRGLVTPSWG